MEGRMKKKSDFIEKIKSFYISHTIGKIFLTIAVCILLVYVLVSIPVWSIRRSDIPKETSHETAGSEVIANDAGKVEVAKSGGNTLLLDTETLTFEVADEEGNVFSTAVAGTDTGSERALISVSYLGEDNNLYEWNSYDQSVAWGSYVISKIDNGVRLDMNLNENESNRFYEYLPKKMSIERYENLFKEGINALKESGELESGKASRYLNTLSLVYKKSLKDECYVVNYTGTPPTSAVNQLIEVAKLVGYTREMLLEDAEQFDFTVSFVEPAVFDIVLEVTLENGELVAHIPTGACKSGNDFYTIQNIKVLPNFGAVTSSQYTEGKIFIPDGSGALADFNSYKANVKEYERPVYNNDFYKDYAFMPQYGEEIFMPVFGVLYGEENAHEKGFLAILEKGARNGYLHMKLASSGTDSSKYNKVYASFDVAQYFKVKINGYYSDSSANYLVNTGEQDLDLTVRYLFYGKNTGYFELAKGYGDYLARKLQLSRSYDEGKAELYLEVVGALNLTRRFVGIPYDSEFSMTDYKELLEIMKDLEGTNFSLQYDGIYNNGWNGKLFNGAKLSAKNGSKREWKNVTEYAKDKGIELYLETSLTKVWESGNGFRASRHALRDFANDEVKLSRYMPVMGIQNYSVYDGLEHETYYTLAPYWLDDITDRFLKKADSSASLAVTDLAGMYYADYRFNSFVSGEEGNRVIENNLEKLSAGRKLALTDPHIDKIGYGNVAVDVSRESSDYITFSQTIPFKQLVMNGLIDYTTEDVNLSSRNPAYFVLQAAETGAIPKFILTYKNVDNLQHSDFNYLYSVQYSVIREKMMAVYEECLKIRDAVKTSEITNHEILADGVFRTTYASGVSVTVNYNQYDVTLKDQKVVKAEGYLIEEVQ